MKKKIFLIEMIAYFYLLMQEHIRRIKTDEIHNHYLRHRVQNELIYFLANKIKTKIVKNIVESYIFQSYLFVLLI